MAKRYDDVPWTAVADAPDGALPVAPCGFVRELYPDKVDATHYRFVPECGNYEIEEREPDTFEFP